MTSEHPLLLSQRQATASALEALQRAKADFENYRKAQQEQQHQRAEWATEALVLALVPYLERAQATPDPPAARALYQDLLRSLAVFGLRPLEIAASDYFNPLSCVAMMQTSGPEGKVVQVFRQGYTLGEQVLRPALVAVGAGNG